MEPLDLDTLGPQCFVLITEVSSTKSFRRSVGGLAQIYGRINSGGSLVQIWPEGASNLEGVELRSGGCGSDMEGAELISGGDGAHIWRGWSLDLKGVELRPGGDVV